MRTRHRGQRVCAVGTVNVGLQEAFFLSADGKGTPRGSGGPEVGAGAMEASVLSPTSWEKRRAWVRQSRYWQAQVLEEEAAAALQEVPELEPSSLDDVFQEGNPSSKIEHWLLDCGSSEEGLLEEAGQSINNGCSSFEDDLTLGAEATLLATNGKLFPRRFLQTARPCQLHDLGCSLASSSMTGGTTQTSSSISDILDKVQEDAEAVLFSLGFGQEAHRDTSRIPARFFTTPSQAKGIDFQLFLKAQVRRIEMEDPCLMLASRFKQVQTLAVTADAFFCLYSYVSKTPVQKFTPSHLLWNYNPSDVPSIRIQAPEPEPQSPRDRLRKAISKMCLYTGSRDRLSLPPTPQKRNSLDQVVWEVMDRVRGEKLVLQQGSGIERDPQEAPVLPEGDMELSPSSSPCASRPKEETQQAMPMVFSSSQTLEPICKAPCCTHSLPREDPRWSANPAQVRRELWELQATAKGAHSTEDEPFWKRKRRARKSLFQKQPLDTRTEPSNLFPNQQKWTLSPGRSEPRQAQIYQLQGAFYWEEMQSNSEEEESPWSSRSRHPNIYQICASKDSRSFPHHHSRTCSDSSDCTEKATLPSLLA
ncbi:protein TESPA1 [Oryctolagus cuniculus]|uniref:Thymocyte expressed, positive selection associated 1 n=1 Tax=Oryctolagus cuniculus TaxID=9986 RepID=G1SPA1_RABIT|nr:protein TESPA1 [Oryctolagus cuniculus]